MKLRKRSVNEEYPCCAPHVVKLKPAKVACSGSPNIPKYRKYSERKTDPE